MASQADSEPSGDCADVHRQQLKIAFGRLIAPLRGKPGPKKGDERGSERWTIKDIGKEWPDQIGEKASGPTFQKIRKAIEACDGELEPEFAAYITALSQQYG